MVRERPYLSGKEEGAEARGIKMGGIQGAVVDKGRNIGSTLFVWDGICGQNINSYIGRISRMWGIHQFLGAGHQYLSTFGTTLG